MDTSTGLIVVAFLFGLAIAAYRRATRFSIKHIQGPFGSFFRGECLSQLSSPSKVIIPRCFMALLGNIREFYYQKNVGDMDFQYTEDYGLAWRMAAPFGVGVSIFCCSVI
jgi:alkylphenol/PAH-inducible cytochrome P450 monooxygenase